MPSCGWNYVHVDLRWQSAAGAVFFPRNELFLPRLIRRDNTAGASHPTPTTAEPSESSTIKGSDGRLVDARERAREDGVQFGSPNLLCIGSSLTCVRLLGGGGG